jgi:hypothetical protein
MTKHVFCIVREGIPEGVYHATRDLGSEIEVGEVRNVPPDIHTIDELFRFKDPYREQHITVSYRTYVRAPHQPEGAPFILYDRKGLGEATTCA